MTNLPRQNTRLLSAARLLLTVWMMGLWPAMRSTRADEDPAHQRPAFAGPIPEAERYSWQPDGLTNVFGTHRGRHWWEVYTVAYSSDGKWIATGGGDRTLRIWDVETLRERSSIGGLPGTVQSVAFSPKDADVAVGLSFTTEPGIRRGQIRIFDYSRPSPTERHRLTGFGRDIRDIVFTPDGKTMIVSEGFTTVRLFEMTGKRPREKRVLPTPDSAWDLAVSGDGKVLAAACGKATVVWDLTGDPPRRRAELTAGALSVAVSPDSKTLVTGSFASENVVRVWDLAGRTPQPTTILRKVADGGVRSVAFSPDGHLLATASGYENVIRLWTMRDGVPENPIMLKGHLSKTFDMAFAPGGKQLATASSDHSLRLWSIDDAPRESDLTRDSDSHLGSVRKLSILPDSRSLLVAGSITAIYDMIERRIRTRFDLPAGMYLIGTALTADGRRLATFQVPTGRGNTSGKQTSATVMLWDAESGRALHTLSKIGGRVQVAAFSPTGELLATAGEDASIRFFDVANGSLQSSSLSGTERVSCLHFLEDDALLSAGDILSDLGEPQIEIHRWQKRDGEWVKTDAWTTPRSDSGSTVIPSLDGKFLVIQNPGRNIEVWEWQSDSLRRQTDMAFRDRQYFVDAISPDGSRLAMHTWGKVDGRPENAFAIWDVHMQQPIREWPLPGDLYDASFTPDGRYITTANGDGTVYLLRVPDRKTGGKSIPHSLARRNDPPRVDERGDRQLSGLCRDFDAQLADYRDAIKSADNLDERNAITQQLDKLIADYATRFMELARRFPDTTTERDALIRICRHTPIDRRRMEAAQRLLDRYVRDPRLGGIVNQLVLQPNHRRGADSARQLLRDSPHRDVRARALLVLAHVLEDYQPDPYRRRTLTGREREVVAGIYRRLIDEYGDVMYSGDRTMKQIAASRLAEFAGNE